MIVQKIFNASSKSIQEKPPYVKPKYRTYRQLLELDKPKKILHYESDDENDDFLQKLMKKQEKQQKQAKKKSKQKKSTIRNLSSKKSQSQSAKKSQFIRTGDNFSNKKEIASGNGGYLSQKIPGQIDEKLLTDKQNNTVVQPNSSQPIIRRRSQSTNLNDLSTSKKRLRSSATNLWENMNLKSIIKSNSDKKKNNLLQERMSLPTVIRLSLDENQCDMMKNQFHSSISGKKSDGVRALREELHKKQTNKKENENIELLTTLSPQKNEIQHSFSPKKSQKPLYSRPTQFLLRCAISPPVQMLLMTKILQQNKGHTRIKQRLFRTPGQQELFLRSLKKPLQ